MKFCCFRLNVDNTRTVPWFVYLNFLLVCYFLHSILSNEMRVRRSIVNTLCYLNRSVYTTIHMRHMRNEGSSYVNSAPCSAKNEKETVVLYLNGVQAAFNRTLRLQRNIMKKNTREFYSTDCRVVFISHPHTMFNVHRKP